MEVESRSEAISMVPDRYLGRSIRKALLMGLDWLSMCGATKSICDNDSIRHIKVQQNLMRKIFNSSLVNYF